MLSWDLLQPYWKDRIEPPLWDQDCWLWIPPSPWGSGYGAVEIQLGVYKPVVVVIYEAANGVVIDQRQPFRHIHRSCPRNCVNLEHVTFDPIPDRP